MVWVKLDDGFPDHPKVLAAGPLAAWLYVCGLAYAARLLTDGFIPTVQVGRLAALQGAEDLAGRLVSVGLWERVDGGYRVHDYLDWNTPASHIKRDRAAAAERMRRLRSGDTPAPAPADSGKVRANTSRTNGERSGEVRQPTPVPAPVPVRSETDTGSTPSAADAAGGVGGAAAMQGGATATAAASAAAADGGVFDPFAGLPGFEPSTRFAAVVAEKYGGLDLGLEALKMADWGREHPDKPLSERRVLNWLQRALEQSAPPRRKGVLPNGRAARFSTDHL
jgi:hypothetical protein